MKIAIVDDHQMVGELLRESLKRFLLNADIKLFNSAATFLQEDFSTWQPAIVITDMVMPEMDGMEMMQASASVLDQSTKFLFLSSLTDGFTIKNVLSHGAKAFLNKGAPLEELLIAVESVQKGKQYIGKSIKDELLNYMMSDNKAVDFELSPREKEVMQKICAGRTPKEIAYDMNLSINTVQLYNNSILKKFNLHRTVDLVAFAIRNGLYK